jgi:hypothetical protein
MTEELSVEELDDIRRRPVHTIGRRPINHDVAPDHPDYNPGEYGRTHDTDCPGCQNTSFTASPRSETYWSS